jgi:nucleoside-diphosphate kinase
LAEHTLGIVKPDAVATGKTGEILRRYEAAGFKIRAMKMVQLSKADAERFYAVHKERPFYSSLTDFMSGGPCVPVCLEGENAVPRLRELMGATNPANAAEGTIRKDLAESIERNAVHGSDSPENAQIELAFFFSGLETVSS